MMRQTSFQFGPLLAALCTALCTTLCMTSIAGAQGSPEPVAVPPVAAQPLPPPPPVASVPPVQSPPPMMPPMGAPQAPPPGQAPMAGPMPPMQMPPPGYIPPMFGPTRLPYAEGDPIPPGYEIAMRPKYKLMTAGIATFAPLYGLSILFAGAFAGGEGPDASQYNPMFIPVIGPFITIGTADTQDAGTMTLLVDGAGQAAGAALFLAGIFGEEKYLHRKAEPSLMPEVFAGPRSAMFRWQF